MLIYGGRNKEGKPLNDLWGLRKQNATEWEWIQFNTNESHKPIPRYQGSLISFMDVIILIGG
ncbi:MAG: hypothetical protein RLZZ574_2297 [Cyanobacteriota bacterium]|jgi:hypothetical protein